MHAGNGAILQERVYEHATCEVGCVEWRECEGSQISSGQSFALEGREQRGRVPG